MWDAAFPASRDGIKGYEITKTIWKHYSARGRGMSRDTKKRGHNLCPRFESVLDLFRGFFVQFPAVAGFAPVGAGPDGGLAAGLPGAGLPLALGPPMGATALPTGAGGDGSSVSLWHPARMGIVQAAAAQSASTRFICLVNSFSFSPRVEAIF